MLDFMERIFKVYLKHRGDLNKYTGTGRFDAVHAEPHHWSQRSNWYRTCSPIINNKKPGQEIWGNCSRHCDNRQGNAELGEKENKMSFTIASVPTSWQFWD